MRRRAPRSMLSISEIEIYKTARSRQGEPAKCHAKRDFLQSMASIGYYETGTGMPVNYLRGESIQWNVSNLGCVCSIICEM